MAQLYLSTIAGPSKDRLNVGLQELCSAKNLNDSSHRSVTVDACDLFQCGKCLKLFTSLNEFVSHKKVNCQGEDVNYVAYPSEGTSSDDSNSQYCNTSGQKVGCVSLTEQNNDSFLLTSNILCDNQLNKDFVDGSLNETSFKVTAFENVQVVSNGGLPVNVTVPASIFLTDITDNTGEHILINDNNNNESETICEPVSLGSNIIDNKTWKCNYCSKIFTKLFNLKQHIRSHTGERPYQCVLCGNKFSQISNARKHIASHKVWPEPWESTSESVYPTENPSSLTACLYSCRYCPLAFDSFSALKAHRKIHSSHKVFKCVLSECSEIFPDVDSLTIHLYSHSPGTFLCSLCNLAFPSFASLSEHHLTHSIQHNSPSDKCIDCKEQSLSCPLCSKVLSSVLTLRRHLRTHLHRSHPCPLPTCPKYFASPHSAKAHFLRTHSPASHTLTHKCHVCKASFKRYDNLMRHRKIHKNKPQFKCPFSKAGCMKAFSRKDVLKNHLFTHMRKVNKCKVCKNVLILAGPSFSSSLAVCTCPNEQKLEESDSGNSDVDEGSEMTYDEGALPSDEEELNIFLGASNSNDIGGNKEKSGTMIDFIGPVRDKEKSFVIPQEGIIYDDENTIEIIVGFA